MSSLKRRFPVFSRVLQLYPKSYYRKYASQTLQTLADILDDPRLSPLGKTRTHAIAWLDLIGSIGKQRLLAINASFAKRPTHIIRRNTLISLALAAPLIIVLSLARFSSPSTSFVPSFWYNRFVINTWSIAMPVVATIIAVGTLLFWLVARRASRPKSNRMSLVWLSVSMIIGAIGIGFIGLSAVARYNSERQLSHAVAQSLVYQREHPTLACSLLPPAAAQSAVGALKVTMTNMASKPDGAYDGVVSDSDGIRVTGCSYIPKKFTDYGISAYVRQANSPMAQQELHDDFFNGPAATPGSEISLHGYNGFYMADAQTFSLSLWVKDYWLEVASPSFMDSNAAMGSMISNLERELAAQAAAQTEAAQRQIVPTAVTAETLSDADKQQVEQLLVNRDLQPAGTNYTVDFSTIAGRRVSGKIVYSNGVQGSFTAETNDSRWKILSYLSEH